MDKDRLAIFIDGPNHSEALKHAKVQMNYDIFLQGIKDKYKLVSARWYSGLSHEEEHSRTLNFLGRISSSVGFTLITKPIKRYFDGKVKANMDIEICVDMMTMSSRLDKVMLFSGDGDFKYLVDTIQRRGIFVTVCSHKPFAAVELRDQASEFLELKELVKEVP